MTLRQGRGAVSPAPSPREAAIFARSPLLLARSIAAHRYAAGHGSPGLRFAQFGRLLGLRALISGQVRMGAGLLLTPLSIVRYWEFPFVVANLPRPLGACLDVASPRLLSAYIARRLDPTSIRVVNPDHRDAAATARLSRIAGSTQVVVETVFAEDVDEAEAYDAIWSVSVIEHIADDGDTVAVDHLLRALRPGGRLILTVPVDRTPWDEYRERDVYGLGVRPEAEGFFFQRHYDEVTIRRRLLARHSRTSVRLSWFGERVAGRFAAYEQDWIRRGWERTVSDPREIADWYRPFSSWSEMPGRGVCGIVIDKQPAAEAGSPFGEQGES